MIDNNAPIIPWIGMGQVELYSSIEKLQHLINIDQPTSILGKYLVRYEINEIVDLWFNLNNGKLFKITALKNYTGMLFNKIHIGMKIDDVLKIEPSFKYDDFEEVYVSNKGIYIETDPIDNTVLWISVFIKEIDSEEFEIGNW